MENYLDALRVKQNLAIKGKKEISMNRFDLEDKFFFDEKVESNHEKAIDAFLT